MHPILFRIPLPHTPLKYWWALAAVALFAVISAALGLRSKDRTQIGTGLFVAAAAGAVAWFVRSKSFDAPDLPLYSYGVMLGLSLVIGWYLTLTLCERDGLPKDTMANCYVITAIAAVVGSRVLYILTNLDEFHSFQDCFDVRRGGLVAYGGFLGGFLGSWLFVRRHRIRIMAWADDVAPSLAAGLFVTRIGCYLFGCDFGKRLGDGAPGWLKKMGTFPHWPAGTVNVGDGSPAYVRHLDELRNTPLVSELTRTNASLPVHPTQIYESLVGLALLILCLSARRTQRFRGQIFLLFVFAYGYARFLLEILRDDTERGSFGPLFGEHLYIPFCLAVMAIAFDYGIVLGIKNHTARLVARVLAFVPVIAVYLALKPESFGSTILTQLSTSQWIGMITAVLAGFFYAQLWSDSYRSPVLAMSLGDGVEEQNEAAAAEARAEEADDDETAGDAEPAPQK
jgi:phosphatidylglycerol:prolipoprotein diacylglycerol transferase